MKKFVRFAGVALLALTIGVVGCDDDAAPVAPTVTVTVPPPTPPTPPPPPPLVVTMSPASAEVAVGSNVVFAVNASGGAAGATASWTCASSDTTIATASVTSSGCQATGVAPGGVTITAPVTKGSETGNVGSQLTVMGPQVGDQAFILLHSIKWGDENENTETTGLKGTVNVQANVERGDQVLERVTLLVDGDSVAATSFGVVAEPAVEEPAAQVVHSFPLSFDSDDYDSSTGSPAYMNGDHEISLQLKVAGSEPIPSNVLTVDFNNDDGYVVMADLGDNSAIGDDGRRWYGGPDNGTIDITALLVSYSGGSVTSVSANFCGEDATDSDGSDGYTFEFGCEDRESNTAVGDMLTIPSPGEDGVILNADDLPFPAFVDFVGPSGSPIIVANRNGRENGWLNAAVALTGEVDADADDDENWLVEGADETGGIGGYNMMLRMGDDLEKALAASPSSSLPAESADNESYCAIASATDDLGNESELPEDDAACRDAPDDADVLVGEVWGHSDDGGTTLTDDVSEQTLKFGVDTTDPTIEFGDDYDDLNRHVAVPGAFAFETEDDESDVGNSGLDDDSSLQVGLQRRTASQTECLTVAANGDVAPDAAVDGACDTTAVTDGDVTLLADVAAAYYTLSGSAQDQAGNSSDAISHTFVYDSEVATATAPAIPGIIEAGEPFDGASYLNDNLSIRDYYVTADFAAPTVSLNLGIGAPVPVDGFDASSLTNRNHAVSTTVNTYAALQDTVGSDLTTLGGVSVAVRDQTGAYADESTTFVTDTPDADEFEFGDFTTDWVGLNGSGVYAFCGIAECADEDAETSVKIEVRVIAPVTGSFSNPLERVDFWVTDINGVSWNVGSDTSGTSGRVGGNDANARFRTWSYSVTLTGVFLNMATRPGTGGSETVMIRAIAVNDDNVGLVVSAGVAIDTTAP